MDKSDEIIAGRHPVLEALKAGEQLEKIILHHGAHGPAIDQIRSLARQRGVVVVEANKERFRELGEGTDQGVVALRSDVTYAEIEDLLQIAKERNEPPFLLILDEIEDPHNLGALIRTAECAGVHGVIIPKHHSATVSSTVTKAAAGATAYVRIAKVTNIAQTLDELKSLGLWIVGTDSAGEKAYDGIDYNGPIAVVIGSEGKGIRRLVKEKCDFLVRIPLYGKIASLNASVAGALVLFEAAKVRHRPR
ncbi:MAG TPA: 23S rRNA (guanosine(2251)-2'-O)-methyltransferase RlmB [Bacteroidota bacterium]|nr:23S rRNA (guanosine(2251)-2'-O)-methyltransferase RlmB [Bacteroidota bacterium]